MNTYITEHGETVESNGTELFEFYVQYGSTWYVSGHLCFYLSADKLILPDKYSIFRDSIQLGWTETYDMKW